MDDTRYGEPNSKRIILYENTYNENGHLINMTALEERKKGKWIDEGQYADFFPHHAYRCSECGHHLIEIEVAYDFCPFCGADMR